MRHRVVVIALALAASAAGAQSAKPGARAPEIDLPTLSGDKVKLSSLRGRPVVVTFWQTWCPSCRTEFPDLIELEAAHRQHRLFVFTVNDPGQEHSRGDGTKHVQAYVAELKIPFPVALDKRGRARDAFSILGLPTTVFVDTAGVIRVFHRGPISREELERGLATILPSM